MCFLCHYCKAAFDNGQNLVCGAWTSLRNCRPVRRGLQITQRCVHLAAGNTAKMTNKTLSWLCVCLCIALAAAQSNYADQANNIAYQGEGLPEQGILDGKVTKLDDLSPVIFLNRTKAALNCAAGSMQIELKFNDKFYGIAYAQFDRNSACRVYGKGAFSYKLELPLKGCGTKQGPQRVFTNNIVVRFNPHFEIDGDEVITIVCRYPPPIVPPPAPLPHIVSEAPASPIVAAPLKGFQILLIICGILFLSLLLLGLGCSYYCLRRRPLTVIRQPFSTLGSGSEITKISRSSLGSLPIMEGVKIPRANVLPYTAAASSAGSEGPLMSDNLPSDYPSESHSEIDVDTGSLPVSSAGSYDNQAYIQDNSSVYSEGYGHTVEQHVQNAVATTAMVPRLPLAVKEQPKFDIQVKVKKSPPPPPSISLSDTESTRTDRNLSTILEQQESIRYVAPTPPPPPPIIPKRERLTEDVPDTFEPPIAIVHKPEITSHMVDDVFLKTITEKKTIEDIERHRRLVTEYHTRAKPVDDQKWNVTIRNYPVDMAEPPEWENFSDISSASGLTLTPKPERATMSLPPQNLIVDDKLPLNAPEIVANLGAPSPPRYTTTSEVHTREESYLSMFNIPPENPEVPNWNVLIRVFQPTEQEEGPVIDSAETFNSQLTTADKMKWRQIITTESTLRTLLTECVIREDYERVRSDTRYTNIFEQPKWDVIIRILAPPDRQPKSKKWDNRSRRSSLPTLYEYDSDGESSVRTLTREPLVLPQRSRKNSNSRSSYRSEADLRSMSEMTVDFGRQDNFSETSSYYPDKRYYEDSEHGHPSLARSLSQPSLARSASEFTERWVAPSRYDTASEFTSPEGTPKSQRSSRFQPPRGTGEQRAVWQTSQASTTAGPRGTSQVVTQEFRSQASSSYVGRSQPPKGWFGDNDSEASYK
ncbi:uncharacterized protein LOC114329106 isoform X2 [Diabrotica virgifera virgifera]|uniref:ZP domain-containing protein n=1 Tax=Diabrotica virgifera virgifera TaxID=50390 RepID=A0ABM5KZB2_DIAVI|nr:uncharacterized protein LOC114329106 isoform X2 [Diabrotica virgifera virgifera]